MAQNDSRRYTLVTDSGGDWVGLYGPDGNLLNEGHSLCEQQMLAALGVEYDSREIDFERAGRCTPKLVDMPGGD